MQNMLHIIKIETVKAWYHYHCTTCPLAYYISVLHLIWRYRYRYKRNITRLLVLLNKTQVSNSAFFYPLILSYTLCTALCGDIFAMAFQIKATVIFTRCLQNSTSSPVFLYKHVEILHGCELLYNGKMWTQSLCVITLINISSIKLLQLPKTSTLFNFNVLLYWHLIQNLQADCCGSFIQF
jgi:hypothetical protein